MKRRRNSFTSDDESGLIWFESARFTSSPVRVKLVSTIAVVCPPWHSRRPSKQSRLRCPSVRRWWWSLLAIQFQSQIPFQFLLHWKSISRRCWCATKHQMMEKKMILKAGPPVKRVNKTVLRDLAAKTWKVAPPKSIFKKRPLSERESIHGWWCWSDTRCVQPWCWLNVTRISSLASMVWSLSDWKRMPAVRTSLPLLLAPNDSVGLPLSQETEVPPASVLLVTTTQLLKSTKVVGVLLKVLKLLFWSGLMTTEFPWTFIHHRWRQHQWPLWFKADPSLSSHNPQLWVLWVLVQQGWLDLIGLWLGGTCDRFRLEMWNVWTLIVHSNPTWIAGWIVFFFRVPDSKLLYQPPNGTSVLFSFLWLSESCVLTDLRL